MDCAEPGAGGCAGASFPPVTVIMACFNSERYLVRALDSILAQTLDNFDVIAVDDGSTDGTGKLLAEYAGRHPRIRPVTLDSNQGISKALNLAAQIARAEWLMIMDADDELLPDALRTQLELLDQVPGLAVVSGRAIYINAEGRELGRSMVTEMRMEDGKSRAVHDEILGLMNPSTLVRRSAFLAVGGYRPMLRTACDVDLWTRMSDSGYRFLTHHGLLLRCRIHGGSTVSSGGVRAALDCEYVRACARARRAGRPEPTQESFHRDWRRQPLWQRLALTRLVLCRSSFRRAGLLWGERRPVRAALLLGCAFVLGPLYVARRLWAQQLA